VKFAVIGLNHGHIYGQVEGLLTIPGAQFVGFAAVEDDLAAQFAARYPDVPRRTKSELLADPAIDLIASASINAERGPLGVETLRAGKHYFVDKPPLTRLEDVDAIEAALQASGKMMFVFYGERMSCQFDIKAKQLVQQGAIGEIVHVMGLGPHRLNAPSRPSWFYDPAQYGGTFNDIASHQVEWFVWITGQRIKSFSSRIGRFGSPAPAPASFEDFADATITGENGVTGYVRVDWFTPEKSPIWGDVRGLIVGTKGTIEIRRTINLAAKDDADRKGHMLMTTHELPPHRVDCSQVLIEWPTQIAQSLQQNRNLLLDHDTLLHVMRQTVRMQREATRVR